MFVIEKDFTFSAAHRLPHHLGACGDLHGHTWKCTVYVKTHALVTEGAETGMVVDFAKLKEQISGIRKLLDHKLLNDVLPNPTAENLAKWIFDELKKSILLLRAVKVEESATSRCTYSP